MLNLIDITKSYAIGPTEIKILKGVNLNVEAGELLAIMGPSGCGKSTLMNILGLLDRPTSGSYAINGTAVAYDNDDNLSAIRNRNIGFIFQQYHLLPKLSAVENVALPLVYRPDRGSDVQQQCMEYLKKVDMHQRADHKPTELSGGQQQRVAIARALAGKPNLILADEPTGALDTKVGREIMALFTRLNEEEGITFILITHDPHIAEQCKRFVRMKDGVIEEQ